MTLTSDVLARVCAVGGIRKAPRVADVIVGAGQSVRDGRCILKTTCDRRGFPVEYFGESAAGLRCCSGLRGSFLALPATLNIARVRNTLLGVLQAHHVAPSYYLITTLSWSAK